MERSLDGFRRPSSPRSLGSGVLTALERLRPYAFHIALAIYWPILLYADAQIRTPAQQLALGITTFAFLLVAARFSPRSERRQVWLMVGLATGVELFCSVAWGLYRYRWGNVPLFVPAGHGLLYLFALRAARTPLMLEHSGAVRRVALACATLWAIGGLTAEPLVVGRVDVFGALLWPVFVRAMRSPRAGVYAACFFITAELELLGTGLGNWTWAASAPVTHLPAGNPPSAIAAGYCLLDALVSRAGPFRPAMGSFVRRMPALRPASLLKRGAPSRRIAAPARGADALDPRRHATFQAMTRLPSCPEGALLGPRRACELTGGSPGNVPEFPVWHHGCGGKVSHPLWRVGRQEEGGAIPCSWKKIGPSSGAS